MKTSSSKMQTTLVATASHEWSENLEKGTVYTKKDTVAFMLDLAGYTADRDLSNVRVLDPCAGSDGQFFMACVLRLHESSKAFGFSFEVALGNLRAVEMDPRKARLLKQALVPFIHGRVNRPKGLAEKAVTCADFLTVGQLGRFDLVVGNPPYIRHEDIPELAKRAYRKLYKTFTDRSDIYVGFFEKSLSLLTDNGKLCFICADRWMKNKYGRKLRALITEKFHLETVVNLHHAEPFESDVYGYPSITLISRGEQGPVWYFELDDIARFNQVLQALGGTAVEGLRSHKSPYVPEGEQQWMFEDLDKAGRFNRYMEQYPTIEEQGFEIGIGVATGADNIFIRKDLPDHVEKELLMPILTTGDIKEGAINWGGHYLLNPYKHDSCELIDLGKYPRAEAYFKQHAQKLKKRNTAKRNLRKWYKTIDRVYPSLLTEPKLLVADIKKSQSIVLDEGKHYPHHNFYFVKGRSVEDLKVLGAILMSDFVEDQMEMLSPKMHGGFYRWQAQNLRKLRVPNVMKLSKRVRRRLLSVFDTADSALINSICSSFLSNLHD